jgi:uncharacterized protein YigA (DUF484 family)
MDLPKDKQALPPLVTGPALPATALPVPEVVAAGPSAEQVTQFLRRHPDFLVEHPELLGVLTPPKIDRGDTVIDMQHFMVQHQRAELTRVKAQQKSLIATTRANLAAQTRVHGAVLAIMAASSFEQLIQIVTTDLAVLIDADVVTIAVERQAAGSLRPRIAHHGVQILEPGTVAALLGPDHDVVFEADAKGDSLLFGDGAGLVRSLALIRLPVSPKAPAGLLCIGTRKPGKFQAGQGTELISFLARALGITIAAWLDLPI